MSFFSDLRAERLIAEIRGAATRCTRRRRRRSRSSPRSGPGAIPKILDALAVADKKETASYVEILTQLVDNKTFPLFWRGLADGSPRTIAAVSWALTASQNYSPNLLIELLDRDDVAKPAVLDIIAAQKNRFSVRDLLQHAYNQEANEKAALFRIIAEMADVSIGTRADEPHRGQGLGRPDAHHHILSRFNRPEVAAAIQTQLQGSEQDDPPGRTHGPRRRWTGRSTSARSASCCAIPTSRSRIGPSTSSSRPKTRRR